MPTASEQLWILHTDNCIGAYPAEAAALTGVGAGPNTP